jgi:enoyl-CoA hydratase/carnithine racemase
MTRNAADPAPPGPRILLRYAAESHVAHVSIDNPAKLNALDPGLLGALAEMLTRLGADPELRAVVLGSTGDKAFVGGADIDTMAGLDRERAAGFITLVHRACRAVRDLPVPVIARLQGFVLGAGMELAAACDLRVAAESARFGMPEVRLGIPSVVEAALLPGLIGWGRTRELLLLGEIYGAAELQQWGFLNRVVPDGALDSAVDALLHAMLAAGPQAVRRQKRLIAAWEDLPLGAAIDAGIDAFAAAWETDEPARMLGEFQAKRRRRSD